MFINCDKDFKRLIIIKVFVAVELLTGGMRGHLTLLAS